MKEIPQQLIGGSLPRERFSRKAEDDLPWNTGSASNGISGFGGGRAGTYGSGSRMGTGAVSYTHLDVYKRQVMGSTPEGTIQQLDMGRGMKKALMKMVEQIGKTVIHPTDKYLMISHCNCLKRAEWLKVEIEKKYAFKGIVIVDTAGVATMYANDGGIIVALSLIHI